MSEAQYFIKREKEESQGPFSFEEVKGMIKAGKIEKQHLIKKNQSEFISAYLISDFAALFQKGTQDLDETQLRIKIASENETLKKINQQKLKEEEISVNEEESESNKIESSYQEFKFDRTTKIDVDYEELEKKYEESGAQSQIEKTKVIKLPTQKSETLDKTKIVKIEEIKKEEPQGKAEEVKEPEKKPEVRSEAHEIDLEKIQQEEEVDTNEATSFFNLEEKQNSLAEEVRELEKEVEVEERDEENKFVEFDDYQQGDSKEGKEKKKLTPITAFAFIVVFYFLLFDNDDAVNTKEPRFATISGPVTKSKINIEKAQEYFKQGIQEYLKDGYAHKVKASKLFKASLENKYRNNPAIHWLILVYGELLPEAKNKRKAQKTVFNLIKQTRSKVLSDVNVALGTAHFYRYFGKKEAAFKVLENFLNLESPNKKLISLYLELALDLGNLVQAQKVVTRLENVTAKPVESYLALARYYKFDQRFSDAKGIIRDGLKTFPKNVALMLAYTEYLIKDERYADYVALLKKVEEVGADQRPTLFALYLERMGVLSALNKDTKQASGFFKLALKLHDSDELRSKLATLDIGGDKVTQNLIVESKSIELVKESQKLMKTGEWDEALSKAVQAADLNPLFVPAQTNLAKIQGDRGYFSLAIQTLETVLKKHKKSPSVNFALVKAYLKANKIKEAKDLINIISNNKLRTHPLYPSLMGHYFFRVKNYSMANKNLTKSILLNPLRDQDYFLMARMFMMSRQYKEAKLRLNEAIILSPLNIDYKIMLSDITYELSGPEAAIGYLRKSLESHVDHPKLMGQIARYYYRNGEIKQFEFYKDKIRSLGKRDGDFYRFLFESSVLEDKKSLALDYGLQLLNIEPGDVETRIALAGIYSEVGNLGGALQMYDSILDRLETYPRIHYLKSKVLMRQKKYADAMTEAELEIKLNPSLAEGYYAKGEVLRLEKNYSESSRLLEKAISIEPENVEALKSLGWIKLRQRHYEISKELYLRAKKSSEADPEIRKQLCLIYEGVGQGRLAIEECELYLKLYPNAPDRNTIQKLINVLK